jgi:hypothetical protein
MTMINDTIKRPILSLQSQMTEFIKGRDYEDALNFSLCLLCFFSYLSLCFDVLSRYNVLWLLCAQGVYSNMASDARNLSGIKLLVSQTLLCLFLPIAWTTLLSKTTSIIWFVCSCLLALHTNYIEFIE